MNYRSNIRLNGVLLEKNKEIIEYGVKIEKYLMEIEYGDEMSDSSDDLLIKFYDPLMIFCDIFKKGDKVGVEFEPIYTTQQLKKQGKQHKKKTVGTGRLIENDRGDMYIDSVNFDFQDNIPTTTIKGLASSLTYNSLRKEFFFSSKNITLRSLIKTALKNIGYADKLKYHVYKDGSKIIKDINLKNVIHRPIQVGALLQIYAKRFGLFLKITSDEIWLCSKEFFKQQPTSATFTGIKDSYMKVPNEINYFWGLRIRDNYQTIKATKLLYYNPKTSKLEKAPKKIYPGEIPSDVLKTINTKKLTEDEAEMLINSITNQFERIIYLNTLIDERLIAGNVVEIRKLAAYDGRYMIRSSRNFYNKTGNYVQLELLSLD